MLNVRHTLFKKFSIQAFCCKNCKFDSNQIDLPRDVSRLSHRVGMCAVKFPTLWSLTMVLYWHFLAIMQLPLGHYICFCKRKRGITMWKLYLKCDPHQISKDSSGTRIRTVELRVHRFWDTVIQRFFSTKKKTRQTNLWPLTPCVLVTLHPWHTAIM